jgi:transcription antitermination factor NusG
MATRTFRLLKSLEGKTASINGATQIRAGVIRPEIIVPLEDPSHLPESPPAREAQTLNIGSAVRIIREPYFGRLGTVVELPPELMEIESGTHARVLKAELDDGTIAVVPRANVEIIVED